MNGNSTGISLDLHQIIDLSEEGMSFQSSGLMDVGETLNFSVDLSDPKTYFHTVGRVVWSNSSGRTGVRFQKTAPEDAVRLKEWLFANAFAGVIPDDQAPKAVGVPIPTDSFPQGLQERAPEESPSPSPFRSYVSGLLAAEGVKQEVESLAFDLDSALQIVVQRALSLTHATGAAIALSDGDEMICRATSGPDAPPLGARLQVGSGFSGECVRTGQLLHCDDSEIDDRVDRENCRSLEVRSIMAAPIRSSHAVIGLVEIFSPDPGAFGDADKTVLQGMAEIVLGAVHRAIQAVAEVKVSPSIAVPPSADPASLTEPSHQATDELVRAMADATPAPSVQNLALETHVLSQSRRIPWILIGAIAVAVFAAAWVIISGWSGGSQGSKRQQHFSEQSRELNRQAFLEGSSLQDLRDLATQGDALAEFTLGLRYATGSDAPQDYTEAVRWFSSAAERGHVMAQSTLGAYYWAGRGVTQDFRKAYFWALLAQSQGDDASRARVPFLVSRLSREDLLAVQRQADDWMKQHRAQSKTMPGRK